MGKHLKKLLMDKSGHIRVRALLGLLSITLLVTLSLKVTAADSDNDGMSDFFETLFGLDPNNPADAAIHSDADNLINLAEYIESTDPFIADSDRDGWQDDLDDVPVSRLYVDWGAPQFTSGDNYLYTAPAWWTSAFKQGGEWQTNSPAWHVSAAESNGIGSLNIQVDRSVLTNNVVLALDLFDHASSVLTLDLLDTNGNVVVQDVVGNILSGQNTNLTTIIDVPMITYPSASWIKLSRQSGEITIAESLLYIDEDGDGLDDEQERQLGTSDQSDDSDGDGLSDYEELQLHGTNPALADTDGDGLDDGAELDIGASPTTYNLYVLLPFVEDFESTTVLAGDIHGQNNWVVNQGGAAIVQSNLVFAGDQALQIAASGSSTAIVTHVLTAPDASVVWLDFHAQALLTRRPDVLPEAGSVFFLLDRLRLIARDGLQSEGQEWISFTNQPSLQAGEWVRYTVKLDYSQQVYSLFLNGSLMGEGLGFASTQASVGELELSGQWGYADNIVVSTNQPAALSFDGDLLPDAWELNYFGNLAQNDSGDPDSDGVSNLAEYGLGTNPSSSDTDADGMPDGWELQHSFNPLSGADAAENPDADGLSNLAEFQAGTDPRVADTDGDGLSDGAEVNVHGTDPLDAEGDADGDQMPDNWEVLYGLNPQSSGDAITDLDNDNLSNLSEYQAGTNPTLADTDGDGLTDDEEVNVYGSSPVNTDSDGDGLSDQWEVDNGTDVNGVDDTADADADGLSNHDEFLADTDPNNPDSDGDGLNDGWEDQLGSNPLLDETIGALSTIQSLNPSQASSTVGAWEVIDDHDIRASSRRGSVTYTVNVANANVYILTLGATQGEPESTETRFYLRTYVDGEYLDQGSVEADGDDLQVATPWLTPGAHTVTFYWNNVYGGTSLQITDISLGTYAAPDGNFNGISDWVDARFARDCTLEVPAETLVSPLTIEGNGRFLSKMSLSADPGTGASALGVNKGVGDRWYANVPLSASSTDVAVSFDDGVHSISQSVQWAELNLLNTAAYNSVQNDHIYIRSGDSLLLAARGIGATNGTSTVTVTQDGTNVVYSQNGGFSSTFPVQFNNAGTYLVHGQWQGSQTLDGSLTVSVVEGSLPVANPVCWYKRLRNWECPALPDICTVEADATVALSREPLGGGGSQLDITMNEIHAEHAVIARLPNGSILDGRLLHGTNLRFTDSRLFLVETLPNNTLVVAKTIVVTHLAPDSTVRIHIFAGGVVFENGTKTKLIGPEDLSDTGEYTVVFIMNPEVSGSSCHTTGLQQNGVSVEGR